MAESMLGILCHWQTPVLRDYIKTLGLVRGSDLFLHSSLGKIASAASHQAQGVGLGVLPCKKDIKLSKSI